MAQEQTMTEPKPWETQLKEGLTQDVAQGEQTMQQSNEQRGAMGDTSFSPRALRIKGKAVGEMELSKYRDVLNSTTQDLINTSGMVDDIEKSKFQSKMSAQMNQFKMMMLKKAGELQLYMAKQGIDTKQQQQMWQTLQGAASLGAQTAVMGIGKKPEVVAPGELPIDKSGAEGMYFGN